MKHYLRIENPCSIALESMLEIPEGKYCHSCSKKVIDFSIINDFEISKILEENSDKKICGIFSKNQLNQPLSQEKQIRNHPSRNTAFTKVMAGIALTASIINSYPAQSTVMKKPEIVNSVDSKKPISKKTEKTADGNFVISGRVLSSDKQQPISAEVRFITVLKIYSAKTDENGYYSLEIPKDILKYESLLEFKPDNYAYDRKLAIYTIENLRKKQVVQLDYNGSDKMYGEVFFGPPPATEKSFVIMDGKKLDYKTFNKSYSLFYSRYEVYHIPKDFVKFFSKKETIEDIFIVFVKPK